jgi:hypothetical protein
VRKKKKKRKKDVYVCVCNSSEKRILNSIYLSIYLSTLSESDKHDWRDRLIVSCCFVVVVVFVLFL